MKNNQFKQLNKIIKSRKSHAGFTLIELLSGLIMSTIVVAGLGFGLYHLTKITRDESVKITARNDSSRANEFIANELRRARTVMDLAGFTAPTGSVPTGGTVRLALDIPELSPNPVVYSVAPANSTWKGPRVIYRWGPSFNQDGTYGTGAWSLEPLVDGLSDSTQNVDCNGTNESYKGFYACRINDITAQLYFTSDVETETGSDTIHTTDTQVVARARARNTNAAEDEETNPLSFRTLAAEYSLGPIGGGAECDDGNGTQSSWFMRTDFINDPDLTSNNGYSPKTWIHDPDRQGQPINIDTSHKLTIASIPIGYNNCTNSSMILSRGNETLDDTSTTHAKAEDGTIWAPVPGVESSDFTIDFSDPRTFNGNKDGDPDYDYHDSNDHPDGKHVKVYKKGSTLADYDGYDDDPDTDDGEDSLGEFLESKGYAVYDSATDRYRLVNDSDYAGDPTLNILADNERIIAVEIGQALVGDTLPGSGDPGDPNPGFDLQDSVFILSTDKFDQEYTYP